MSDSSINFAYKETEAEGGNRYKVFVEQTHISDPTVFNELNEVLSEHGLEIEYEVTTNKHFLHVNLENGASVRSALGSIQDIAGKNQIDEGRKIEVKIEGPTQSAVKEFKGLHRDELGVEERINSIMLKTVDLLRIFGKKHSSDYINRKEVSNIIEETKAAGNDLKQIIISGIKDSDLRLMMVHLGLTYTDENDFVSFTNCINSAFQEFPVGTVENQALAIIYRQAVYHIINRFRLPKLVDKLKVGGVIDFRKLNNSNLKDLFKGFFEGVEGQSWSTMGRFFAEVLRDILKFENGNLKPEEEKIIEILAFPLDSSPLENGMSPKDKFISLVRRMNVSNIDIIELSEFLKLPEIDPDITKIYSYLKILALIDIPSDELINIFTANWDLHDVDSILIELKNLIENEIPIVLSKNYAKEKNSLLLGETLAYLEYLFSDLTNIDLEQERESFLEEFYDEYVGIEPGDIKFNQEILKRILKIMSSGRIINFSKENLDKFKLSKIENDLSKGTPTPPLAIGNVPAEQDLKLVISTTGLAKDARKIKIDAEGHMPELIELFLNKQEVLSTQRKLMSVRENLSKVKNLLEHDGDFQYLVTLFNNSDEDQENIKQSLFEHIFRAEGAMKVYREFLVKFFKEYIAEPNDVEKERIARYISSKLIVDVLVVKTIPANIYSRVANPDESFLEITGLNLSPQVQEILATYQRSDGKIDIASMDDTIRDELVRNIKAIELKLEILKILEQKNGVLTEAEKNELIENIVEVFLIGEKDERGREKLVVPGKSAPDILRRVFKEEINDFIKTNLDPVNWYTGSPYIKNIKNGLIEEKNNLNAIIGRSIEVSKVGQERYYDNLKSITEDIRNFAQKYKDNIESGKIELTSDQAESGFRNFIDNYKDVYIKNKIEKLRTKLDSGAGDLTEKLKKDINKFESKTLKEFISNKFLTPGLIGEELYLNVIAFAELFDGSSFTEEEYNRLFAFLNRVTGRQRELKFENETTHADVDITIDGVTYDRQSNRELGAKLLKYWMKKSLDYSEEYNSEFNLDTEATERIRIFEKRADRFKRKKEEKKKPETSKKPSIVRMAKKVLRRETIPIVAGASLGVASMATGTFGFVLAGGVMMGGLQSLRMENHKRNKESLEFAETRKRELLEVMHSLPNEVRQHTQNVVILNFAEQKLENTRKYLDDINKHVYPLILRQLDRKKKKGLPKKISIENFEYKNKQVNRLMYELRNLIDLDQHGNIAPLEVHIRIYELLKEINTFMRDMVLGLEKNILDNKLDKTLHPEYVYLKDLSDYYRGRFLERST